MVAIMKLHSFRLQPDQDLLTGLTDFVKANDLRACSIVTAVGSLKEVCLRLADSKTLTHLRGPHELVSMVGTFSVHGLHLHMAVSDHTGKTIGGHVKPGNLVHTTMELTLVEDTSIEFLREADSKTGYLELKIKPRPI